MTQSPSKSATFSKLLRRDWREWLTFLAFVGPNLGLFVYFTYYPLIRNVLLSFQDYNTFIDEGEYIGENCSAQVIAQRMSDGRSGDAHAVLKSTALDFWTRSIIRSISFKLRYPTTR